MKAMCYDISFSVHINELSDYFPGIDFPGQPELDFGFEPFDHIAGHAYSLHPVIYINRATNVLSCRMMEWGCIPFYVKDEKTFLRQRAGMLNARSERILEDRSSYWFKIRNRRCLIPVSGIYEHRSIAGWKKKVPYFIRLRNQRLFFLPGLFSVAELPDTETGELLSRHTFTLITRGANSLMKDIHNDGENKGRMPLFLMPDTATEFVADNLSEDRYREILEFEMPSDKLEYWPVFTVRTAKARPDGKNKSEPWTWENLPPLGVNPG